MAFSGLAAGDAICRSRAGAAGLDNAQNFVALLSDSTDDAYCRLHGVSGTVLFSCGQRTLPNKTGPWVNTRGENLAESLSAMVSPTYWTYRPIRYDEFGNAVNSRYFTATSFRATLNGFGVTCGDWTERSNAIVSAGGTNATAGGIFGVGGSECSTELPIACFEVGPGPSLEPESPQGSLVFLTDAQGNGNLGGWPGASGATGIDAADAICRASATAAKLPLPDDFIAWISDDTFDAADRFEYQGPWYRTDGVLVAQDFAELTGGNLKAPMNLTESGVYVNGRSAWTGSWPSGLALPENCRNWTSGSTDDSGRSGISSFTDAFSNYFQYQCDRDQLGLYCLHNVDIDPIFVADFE